MTRGMPESTVATRELVVPRSMPTILLMGWIVTWVGWGGKRVCMGPNRYDGTESLPRVRELYFMNTRPHPVRMASQARHKFVSPKELCALRTVASRGEGETSPLKGETLRHDYI